MCGNVKHDEFGNHVEEVQTPATPEVEIDATEEFTSTPESGEVPEEVNA